jgi:ribosomal protein L24E
VLGLFIFSIVLLRKDRDVGSIIMITCQACGREFEREINEVRIMRNEHVDGMPSRFCSHKCEVHGWDPEAVSWAKQRRKYAEKEAE